LLRCHRAPFAPETRLDKEFREIDNALREAEFRDKFVLEKHSAVRVTDLQNLLLRYRPDIVHFSGHGNSTSEIIVESDSGRSHPISVSALGDLFSVFNDSVRCVVLNACYSEIQAEAISQHIDCVVGMSNTIGDEAAISFSRSFYQAIGYGRDINTAFKLGCLEMDLEKLGEKDTPKLLARQDVIASEFSFSKVLDSSELSKVPVVQNQELYVDSIRKLLKTSFATDVQFESFYHEFFPIEIKPNIPLYWKIEFLIQYCQKNSKLDELLSYIRSYNEAEYNKFVSTKAPKLTNLFSKWLKVWRIVPQNLWGRIFSAKKLSKNIAGAQCEITLSFPYEQFSGDIKDAAISAIAHEFNIPMDQVKVISMREGSVILKLELPSESLDKIITKYEEDRAGILRVLGIDYVIETGDVHYDFERIKLLFTQGFSLEQLRVFAKQNYAVFAEAMPETRELIFNRLIKYSIESSEISQLLDQARGYNVQAYEQYRPYYRIFRKPFQKTIQPKSNRRLSARDIFTMGAKGFGTAFLGAAVLSLINLLLEGARMPVVAIFALGFVISFATVYLGTAVGTQVVKAAKDKDDPRLGRIAVISYLMGFIAGYVYPVVLVVSLREFDSRYGAILFSICVLPIIILFAFVALIFIYLSDQYGIFKLLLDLMRLILGSYFAYRSARSQR
jgi:hypothetical protein